MDVKTVRRRRGSSTSTTTMTTGAPAASSACVSRGPARPPPASSGHASSSWVGKLEGEQEQQRDVDDVEKLDGQRRQGCRDLVGESLDGSCMVKKSKSGSSPPTKKTKYTDFATVVRRSFSRDSRGSNDLLMAGRNGPEMGVGLEGVPGQEAVVPSSPQQPKAQHKARLIHDSVHGHIEFPAVAFAIIDTPQFQRLRNIMQLGMCHYVYPTATHTRFQHCLGVAHLAKMFAKELQRQHPDLVDDKDVVCVMLAGLCHDLGHGPFSHLWEAFVHEARPDSNWHHEDASIQMLDYLIEDNNLKDTLREMAGIDDQDIRFIKEQIAGPLDDDSGLPLRSTIASEAETRAWPYRGRSEDKSFLYEIVANKISGIDVDKWDYFLRDDYYLKINHIFNYKRFIKLSKIVKTGDPPRRRICILDKESENLLEMFQDRARLHRHGYQHRVTKIADKMLRDALLEANDAIQVSGKDGKKYSLADACQDMVAYEKLTDSVFYKMLEMDERPKAVDLLKRIQRRQFYKTVMELRLKNDNPVLQMSNTEVLDQVFGFISTQDSTLKKNDIAVLRRSITMGMGSRNPIEEVIFYSRNPQDHDTVEVVDSPNVSLHLPDVMLDKTIWICCKRMEQLAISQVTAAAEAWKNSLKLA